MRGEFAGSREAKRAAYVMLRLFAFCALLIGSSAFASPETEITALMTQQSQAWNRGDIDAFMAIYAPIAELRFASGGTVTRGWKPTLEGYKKRYPDAAAMGQLTFSELEFTVLAPDAAIVFGHWQLARAKDRPHGLFTLTWKKSADGWKIIQDHTSTAAP
jgi:ketosteroid isomerase-like protein